MFYSNVIAFNCVQTNERAGSLKNLPINNVFTNHIYIYIYITIKFICGSISFKLQTLLNQNLIEYPLSRPYARHVLRRKNQSENTHTHTHTPAHTHTHTYIHRHVYTCTKKRERTTGKFKTTQPHAQNFPKTHTHTHSHTHRRKKNVSETQNHSNTRAHTHNYKHFKFQRGVKADQSKHTLGKRENNPYINPPDQPKVSQTGNKSEFKSHWVPH